MARQEDRVQLEQSEMRPALDMAKMAKNEFSCAATEKMQQLVKEPRETVREEQKRGVETRGH
jgi:hypothetical protein